MESLTLITYKGNQIIFMFIFLTHSMPLGTFILQAELVHTRQSHLPSTKELYSLIQGLETHSNINGTLLAARGAYTAHEQEGGRVE